jgi:2-dehydro-3-deoxyphosphogluconate aldolase / (4S)-4-hydroxy-2-oxoglutarate aldolase
VLLGVGTVLSVPDAERALEAGARYVVTPVGLPELVAPCHEAGAACLLSGLTPTEVLAAWQHGADAVKVFPASSMGGPGHVAALRSVLPHIPLVPTGGVNRDNLPAFLTAGAACVGVGGELINDRALERSDPDDLVKHARTYLETFHRWTDKENP